MPIPLTVQSYQSRSLPFSNQRLVNLYPEGGTVGSKGPVLLVGTPGLKTYLTVGSGPIRGMQVMGNYLYVVSGNEVYSIDSSNTSNLVGTILGGGVSNVSIANNGTQLCIVADRKGFIATPSSVVQITDVDFPGADSVTYIDGYFVFNDGETIFNSALGDGTSYNALDTATAEYDPDTVVAVLADHSDLLVFGKNTIEPYYNAAGANFPFAPRRGSAKEIGLLARDTLKKLDEKVFFLSSNKEGGRVVRMMAGYQAVRISTPAIEKVLDEYDNIEDAVAFAYEQEGHAFYCLKLPGTACFCYDVSTGYWHERESYQGLDWRVSHYATAFNRRFVGDDSTGKIFELDLDTNTDDGGTTIQRIVNWSPIFGQRGEYLRHNSIEVDVDAGTTSDLVTEPVISLAWSDDGEAFTGNHDRGLGLAGNRTKRARWLALGLARSRVYQTAVYDDMPVRIKGAYADIEAAQW